MRHALCLEGHFVNIPPQDPEEKKLKTQRASGLNTISILLGLVFVAGMALLMAFGLLSLFWDGVKANNYAWVGWVLGLGAVWWIAKKFFGYLDSEKGKKLGDTLGNILAVLFVCGIIASVAVSCSGSGPSHCKPTRYIDC